MMVERRLDEWIDGRAGGVQAISQQPGVCASLCSYQPPLPGPSSGINEHSSRCECGTGSDRAGFEAQLHHSLLHGLRHAA